MWTTIKVMHASRSSSDEELTTALALLADLARSVTGFRGTTLYQDLDSQTLHCVTFWATEQSARTYTAVLAERKDVVERLFHAETQSIALLRTVAHCPGGITDSTPPGN